MLAADVGERVDDENESVLEGLAEELNLLEMDAMHREEEEEVEEEERALMRSKKVRPSLMSFSENRINSKITVRGFCD